MVVIVLFALVFSVLLLFFYCYCGRVATESFEMMSDALYEANWHKLPIQQQKYFILMIKNAQRPLYYHGSGVAILNLQTFTKVSQFESVKSTQFSVRIKSNIFFSYFEQFTPTT